MIDQHSEHSDINDVDVDSELTYNIYQFNWCPDSILIPIADNKISI